MAEESIAQRRQQGTIINRGVNRWYVCVYLGWPQGTARRIYHRKTLDGTYEEAQAYVQKILKTKDKRLYRGCQGYVYILRAENNIYKIGRTTQLKKRLKKYTTLPVAVELCHYFKCKDAAQMENSLHVHFREKHVRGEWFRLTEQDIAYLKSF